MSTAGVLLRFTFATATTEPPSNSQVRLDVGEPYLDVAHVWVDYNTDDGLDAFHFLLRTEPGDELVVQDLNDHTRALHVRVVAAPVDRGGYLDFAVVHLASTGLALANNQDVLLLVLEVDAITPTPPEDGGSSALALASWGTVPNLSILTVPPTVEPLTLAEAKLRAALVWPDGDPRDAMMHSFIKAARERVERDTGIAMLTQTREVYLNHFVSVAEFPPPARPLQSIVEIASPDPALYPWARRLVVGHRSVADIPPSLLFAIGLLTAHYATAARDAVVVSTGAVDVMPLGYLDAIADFRRVSV